MASNVVKDAFTGLIGRGVRSGGRSGGFGKEDDNYKEEGSGEKKRPKVGQNG